MHGQLTVELADLRGWAAQVGRAGDDCAHLGDYVTSFVPDGDFGRILSLIRADYERFCLSADEVLEVEAGRLSDTGAALRLAAANYSRTDERVAKDLGVGAAVADNGRVGRGFDDTGPTTPPPPECGGEVLPTVTFGGLFDQANDLLMHFGGPDVRSWATDFVAGDVGKALSQASVWEHTGRALAAVSGNLSHGSRRVARSWDGAAATSSGTYSQAWIGALDRQSDTMARVAAHLRDAVEQAVDVAQLVVDVVKEMVAVVLAGWSHAYIPIFGQVEVARRLRDVLRLLWDAKKVVAVFWYFLLCLKDFFVSAADLLTGESLPDAPSLPASAA
jgi:hypothetical protein